MKELIFKKKIRGSKKFIKRTLSKSFSYVYQTTKRFKYHRGSGKFALQKLKKLGAYGIKLSNSDKKLCDEYAIDILGGKHFSPWLNPNYLLKRITFKKIGKNRYFI